MPRQSPLHTAAESGDVAAVQAELAKGEGTEVLNDGFNETPLHRAAVHLLPLEAAPLARLQHHEVQEHVAR